MFSPSDASKNIAVITDTKWGMLNSLSGFIKILYNDDFYHII